MVNVTELNRKPELDLSVLNGADFDNAPENQILVTQGDGTLAVETQAEGPNPYDQAQTFAESDVTITTNTATVSNGSIEIGLGDGLQTIDDFESGDLVVEDGDWSDWAIQQGTFNAQQSTVLSGSWSGELSASDETSFVTINRNPNAAISRIDVQIQIESFTGDNGDSNSITFQRPSDEFTIITTRFLETTTEIEVNGNTAVASTTAGTTYTLSWRNIDYSAETFDFYVDGVEELTNISFNNSASSLNQIQFVNDTSNSASTRSHFIDNLISAEAPATSGNALIEWDRGIPTDIFSWDVATFTRTLDNETVTVDVEDGNGDVLLSDIDRNTDISSVADQTNIKLRANISRNDTANNPTLDSAYRSWFI